MKKTTIVLLVVLLFFASCKENKTFLSPPVSGKAGEVLLIVEDHFWKTSVGDSLQNVFLAEYPLLPQREPYFDLVQIPSKAFSDIFRSHRNIVQVEISSRVAKAKMEVKRNVWASPQLFIKISAPDQESFIQLFERKKDQIVRIIETTEQKRLLTNYIKYEEIGITRRLREDYNILLTVPKGYSMDVKKDDFIWLAHESRYNSLGILVYFYEYSDTSLFAYPNLIAKRNEYLKKYVPGPEEGTFMMTEMLIDPSYHKFIHKDRFTVEMRGLWKVYKFPMGGPFISYSTVDEKRNRIVTVEGFVFAPKYDKLNYLRQVEAIVSSLDFTE